MDFVRIELIGGGSYVVPLREASDAITGELSALEGKYGEDEITLKITKMSMTKAEYDKLSEFEGH